MIEHYDLFAGIGGFSLALDNVFGKGNAKHIFVERDEFCQLVLRKHWPEAEYHSDINQFIADTEYFGKFRAEEIGENNCTQSKSAAGKELFINEFERSDRLWKEKIGRNRIILTGGFPCQPFSQAGRRQGTADDRYLWPAMFESIKLIRPNWIIAENVAGLVSWSEGLVLEQVCSDLESEDYEVQPFIIPACAVNAPHRRERVWIVANRKSGRSRRGESKGDCGWESKKEIGDDNRNVAADPRHFGQAEQQQQAIRNQQYSWNENWVEVATRLCGIFNGLSAELDETKLKNYADLSKKIRSQDLPYLWHNFQSEEVQWKIGRFDPLQQKNYLFTILWQLTAESRGQNNLSFQSEEVQEAYLRNVWLERKIGCTPQRWEYQEQYAREHSNTLSQLSHEIALATAEICKWYNQDRNPRLKALGNAVVVPLVEVIMQKIKEVGGLE